MLPPAKEASSQYRLPGKYTRLMGLWTILLSALSSTLLSVPSYLTDSIVPRSESHQNRLLQEEASY